MGKDFDIRQKKFNAEIAFLKIKRVFSQYLIVIHL